MQAIYNLNEKFSLLNNYYFDFKVYLYFKDYCKPNIGNSRICREIFASLQEDKQLKSLDL